MSHQVTCDAGIQPRRHHGGRMKQDKRKGKGTLRPWLVDVEVDYQR
jgi:hypothetical protein